MENNSFEFDLKDPVQDFQSHLDIPNNRRIIFSGRYGTGKTYFLKKFFDQKTDYFVVNLKPVSYSVASNEDIFRFIKYDILLHLQQQNVIDWNIEKYGKMEYLPYFLKNNIDKFIETTASMAARINPAVAFVNGIVPLVKAFSELKTQFEQEIDKLNKNQAEEKYLDFLKETGGSYFFLENDFIVSLITVALDVLKEGGKKTVLIIDDLDRVDPEHIFRILNVFSAHLDFANRDNVFGFDHVLFVCDLENIKHIYQERYGRGVDFSGYIDRFYSSYVFQYFNMESVKRYCENYIGKLERTELGDKQFSSYDARLSYETIVVLLRCNIINLRNLIKFMNVSVSQWPFQLGWKGRARIFDPTGPTILFLSWILGGYEAFIEALEKAESIIYTSEKHSPTYSNPHQLFADLLVVTMNVSSSGSHDFTIGNQPYRVEFKFENRNSYRITHMSPAHVVSDAHILWLLRKKALRMEIINS